MAMSTQTDFGILLFQPQVPHPALDMFMSSTDGRQPLKHHRTSQALVALKALPLSAQMQTA
jgi:hypothetical protein